LKYKIREEIRDIRVLLIIKLEFLGKKKKNKTIKEFIRNTSHERVV